MDTSPLAELGKDWPHDSVAIPIAHRADSTDMRSVFARPARDFRDRYLDSLQLDETATRAIQNFAANNALTYRPYDQSLVSFPTTADAYKSRPAWAGFLAGTSQYLAAHVTSGQLYGFPVTMFIGYQFAGTHYGTDHPNDMVLQPKGIVRIKLGKIFPQLVLDSNKNNKGISSSIDMSFNQNQRLTLEGNFNTYFDFYAPTGLQINALTVLSPNFMQMIMDSSALFDVEFFGDEMILITKEPLYTQSTIDDLSRIVLEQLTYMSRLLESWSYVPLQQPFDLLDRSFFGGSDIKLGPLRITPKWFVIGIATLFIALLIFGISRSFSE